MKVRQAFKGRVGAIFSDNGVTSMHNCVVEGNTAWRAGAIFMSWNAGLSMYNCTLENNTAVSPHMPRPPSRGTAAQLPFDMHP